MVAVNYYKYLRVRKWKIGFSFGRSDFECPLSLCKFTALKGTFGVINEGRRVMAPESS
jgi:hypothetical protein